jgi:hypothetical protein
MDTKLLQKIAIGLICLCVLVIIGLTIYRHQLLKKMSQGAGQEKYGGQPIQKIEDKKAK